MNYSTLKKTVALSIAAALGVGMANAQTTASGTTTPKVFGGIGQYNTWTVGVNVGVTSPVLMTGGSSDYNSYKVNLGYGVSVEKMLSHVFGLELNLNGGQVGYQNNPVRDNRTSDKTTFYGGSLVGTVNIATVSFLHRKNSVNFYVSGGTGLLTYHPEFINGAGVTPPQTPTASYYNADGSKHWITEFEIPVTAGVKFKLSEVVALNFGYTETFIDGDNFDGLLRGYPTKDRFSYGFGGLDFTLGSKSKPNIEWVNPVALVYDELYDAELRREVAALKTRVGNVETAVNDLKKDSDGDGVSDQFDKCPNTPAGTVVDGSGCEIKFPPAIDTSLFVKKTDAMGGMMRGAAWSNIQFDFDSSVLRTSSYPALDATSSALRGGSGSIEVDGFASSEGTAAHNLRLSKDRANSVKTYLVNSGVDAKRIKVKGFGETRPIADNSTEAGREQNRRVEFKK